jgi:DHA2 family lincomycin resistance protein-like MFS transporter
MHSAQSSAQQPVAPDYAVLRWLVGATFVVILNETIMINAIPRLMADFAVNANAAQWLSTAFMLTMAVVIPITGWFLQRVTTRFAFGLAMGVFCAGTLLAAAAWTFPVLLVARVIQAGGTAVMMPLLMTTLMAVVPVHDRGRVMGNVTLAMSVAPALGPAVSGVVLQSLSWRWIFLVVLPIAAAIGVFGLHRLVNVGEPVAGTVDWLSVVIAAMGFGSLVYGLSEVGVQGDHTIAYAALAVGVAGVGGFIWRQLVLQRVDRPLLDLRALRIRVFSLSLGVMAIAFMAMLGSMILLQLYLQNVRDMSPLATGMLVMPGGLAMGLLGPRVGRVYDALGARVLVIPGAIGLLASMTAFVALDATTPTWQILVAHVVLMISLAALFTPVFTMGLGSLPPHLYSHGSSLLGTIQQIAGAMGTALVVTIMTSRATSLVGDGVAPVAASLDGMRWAFAVAAGLCVIVLALVAMMPARIDDPDSTPAGAEPEDATIECREDPDEELVCAGEPA